MKIISFTIIVLCMTLILFGCKGEPGMEGYVMHKENGRILVVDSVPQDFSSTGGINEFYNAISFSKAPENIKIGDRVKVWFDNVAESYPGQSEVKHIEVIEVEKPADADLTESEALNRILTVEGQDTSRLFAVKSIIFNRDTDQWTIVLKDVWDEKGKNIEFQVEDK